MATSKASPTPPLTNGASSGPLHPGQHTNTLQVINVGLPRTGTTSVGAALSILLHGPVVDGGALAWLGSARQQRLLLELIRPCPLRTVVDRTFALYGLARLTEGCVAATDVPFCYFVEELLQLYPRATVVCTRRERESWWQSYKNLWWRIDDLAALGWVSPTLRRFLDIQYGFLFRRTPQAVGITEGEVEVVDGNRDWLYDAHEAYVRRVVPEGQLHFVDVRDGWKPLCDILGLPVPDVEFPRENTRQRMDPFQVVVKRRFIIRGVLLVSVGLGACGGLVYLLRRALGGYAWKLW
ncbi:hypothetical protein BFW01_g5845 [Lasiodiplodia theobromae]|nr:hypothetical protein BFW01_g5845 [Lasiodiplodia theobromae]